MVNGFLMILHSMLKFLVMDMYGIYLMFDLCCELAMMVMLKSSDYRMSIHTVFLYVFQNM